MNAAMLQPTSLTELAPALCRIFLGWRLREDYAALVALGEGALRIDLITSEAWSDGEPLPPLFIAGELARELTKQSGGLQLELAQLDAVFAPSSASALGVRRPPLELTCRVTLRAARGETIAAEANNSGNDRSAS